MWEFFRGLFKNSEHKPKPTEPLKTNLNEEQAETSPKEGMPENYWQEKIDNERLPINENPTKAEGRSIGDLDKMENASTITKDDAVHTIDDEIKQIIEERELPERLGEKIEQDSPAKSWVEKVSGETDKTNVIDEPDTGGGTPFLGGGGSGGSGGGSAPGRDLDDINEDKDANEPDDTLSKNEEQYQNPLEDAPEKEEVFALLKENSNSFLQPEMSENNVGDPASDEEKEEAFTLLASNSKGIPEEVTRDLDLPEYLKEENMLAKETIEPSEIEAMDMGEVGGADGGGDGGDF